MMTSPRLCVLSTLVVFLSMTATLVSGQTQSQIDAVPPVVRCINDVTEVISLGGVGAVVQFTEPTATDNSGSVSLQSASHRPGQFFLAGTTTVTYTFIDPSQNTAQFIFDVIIIEEDRVPPEVICPPDVRETVEFGSPGRDDVVWPDPTATDNSGIVSLVSQSRRPNTFFVLGETTVTYVYVDGSGNTNDCTFNVLISAVDTVSPVVTCPSNPEVTVEIGATGAVVTWPEPNAQDLNVPVTLLQQSHTSGQTFQIGQTQVTYIYQDAASNIGSCTFQVIVETVDNIPPVVQCGQDIVRQTSFSTGGLQVNFAECTATDYSGTAVLVSRSHTPGQFFTIGSTVVTYTFTDPTGNTGTGSFTITVNGVDDAAPVVQCGQDIVRQTSFSNGGLQVNFAECTATDDSGTAILVSRSHTPGQFFAIGSTVVTFTFTDPTGNTGTGSFTITVNGVDDAAPVVQCGQDIVRQTPFSTGGLQVNFAECTATDDSGTATLVSRSHTPGQFFAIGSTVVTYTFTDPTGNAGTGSFTITVNGVAIDAIQIINCPQDISQPPTFGGALAEFNWTPPTGRDRLNNVIIPTVNRSPPVFLSPGQQMDIVYTFQSGSDVSTCTFTLTVNDEVDPVVNCINDVTEVISLGGVGAVVQFTAPTATDNSGSVSLQSASHRPGQFFLTGTTTVTYIFIDPSGNTAVCTFDVNVIEVDNVDPTVFCIQDISQIVAFGSPGTTVTWVEPTATDNSGLVSIQQRSNAPGDFFLPGTTEVTYVFADTNGNNANCVFTVTVTPVDDQYPTVFCIQDISQIVAFGSPGANVTWVEPTATDNSGSVSIQQRSNAPGDFFPSGTTEVTYVFADPTGNTAKCVFTVTVTPVGIICPPRAIVERALGLLTQVDWTNPVIGLPFSSNFSPGNYFKPGVTKVVYLVGNDTVCSFSVIVEDVTPPDVMSCNEDMTVQLDAGETYAVVDWIVPMARDREGGPVIVESTRMSGDRFEKGLTIVEYHFSDNFNNRASCSFSIEVLGLSADITPPMVINCPNSTLKFYFNEIKDVFEVTWPTPSASDDSSLPVATSSSHDSGDHLGIGRTNVTYNFTDAAGNLATCQFSVEIAVTNDTENAVKFTKCPSDIEDDALDFANGTYVSWETPLPLDINVRQTHHPGDFFPIGRTEVTYRYLLEGDRNVVDMCQFHVKVKDVTPPVVINCPPSNRVASSRGSRTVDWKEPTAIDNSNVPPYQFQTHFPRKSLFKHGTFTVNYTFRDISGNIAKCSFDITHHRGSCIAVTSQHWIFVTIALVSLILLYILSCKICVCICGNYRLPTNAPNGELEMENVTR